MALASIESHQGEEDDKGHEAVQEVDGDAPVLDPANLRGHRLDQACERLIQPIPVAIFDMELESRRRIIGGRQAPVHQEYRGEDVTDRLTEGIGGILHPCGLGGKAAIPGVAAAQPAMIDQAYREKRQRHDRHHDDEEDH